jgi:hypothetical protein
MHSDFWSREYIPFNNLTVYSTDICTHKSGSCVCGKGPDCINILYNQDNNVKATKRSLELDQ